MIELCSTVIALRHGPPPSLLRKKILLASLLAIAVVAAGTPAATAAVPDDPSFARQWGDSNTGQGVPVEVASEAFGAPKAGTRGADDGALRAWKVTTGSRSIVIGEADTGVDVEDLDLRANIWTNPGGVGQCGAGTHGYNVLDGQCEALDTEPLNPALGQLGGHGTHVAGIIGAVGDNKLGVAGVNWHTTILPVKWLQNANAEEGIRNLVAALRWFARIAREGVNLRVVNDSPTFGGTPTAQEIAEEREAIEQLGAENVLFVVAAGNGSQDNDEPTGRYPCKLDLPNEICVTASDDQDKLPGWASYGPHTVDLAAPGVSIYSTLRGNGYGYISGGSMAAAQVSGAAGLILAVAPTLTARALKADILDSVDRLPSLSGKVITGGRLNICRALPGCEGQTPVSRAVLLSSTLIVNDRRASVALDCAGASTCSGTLTIVVKHAVHVQGTAPRTVLTTIGRARFSLRGRRRGSFVVALTRQPMPTAARKRLDAVLTIAPSSRSSRPASKAVQLVAHDVR